MKKRWIVFTVLLIVALTAFLYIRFFFVFGEGVKSGELNYVVYKGLVFKTYEGKLIQSGIRSKTAGTIQSYEFEFSVENEALARKLMLRIVDLGLPVATEMLDPIIAKATTNQGDFRLPTKNPWLSAFRPVT